MPATAPISARSGTLSRVGCGTGLTHLIIARPPAAAASKTAICEGRAAGLPRSALGELRPVFAYWNRRETRLDIRPHARGCAARPLIRAVYAPDDGPGLNARLQIFARAWAVLTQS
jgi:hypothetical protein